MFTVDITDFVRTECMRDYSASIAELGNDAARATWQACLENAPDWGFLKPENREEFAEWVAGFGAWTREEIAAWTDAELSALCFQWIAGDVREVGADNPAADWETIRQHQESGRIPSSIYRADDGRIYWECM